MDGSQLQGLIQRGKELRWKGLFLEASVVFGEAVSLAEQMNDLPSLADALVWLAIVRSQNSSDVETMEEALRLQERALAIELSFGDKHSLRIADTERTLATTLIALGRRSEALTRLRNAAVTFHAQGARSFSAIQAFAALTDLLIEVGAFDDAVTTGAVLLNICKQHGDPVQLYVATFSVGRALAGAGRKSEAIAHFERVLELAAPRIAQGHAPRLVAEVNLWIEKTHAAGEANRG